MKMLTRETAICKRLRNGCKSSRICRTRGVRALIIYNKTPLGPLTVKQKDERVWYQMKVVWGQWNVFVTSTTITCKTNFLVLIDENRLMTFLRGCKFSLEKCKRKLDMYFTMRTACPEFFTNRDITRPELQEIVKVV